MQWQSLDHTGTEPGAICRTAGLDSTYIRFETREHKGYVIGRLSASGPKQNDLSNATQDMNEHREDRGSQISIVAEDEERSSSPLYTFLAP